MRKKNRRGASQHRGGSAWIIRECTIPIEEGVFLIEIDLSFPKQQSLWTKVLENQTS